MKIKQNVPLVCTGNTAAAKDYYEKYFGFKTVFDSGDFVGLKSNDGEVEISFMRDQGCKMMTPYDNKSLVFCFQVDDVDGSYQTLCDSGLSFVQPPTDNPWGDRSAITMDPLGIQVYLYTPIAMSDELKQFVKE